MLKLSKISLLLFLPGFLLMPSCELLTGKTKCERIIEKDKMVNIMVDKYLLESYIKVHSRKNPSVEDSVHYYYRNLFNKHNISKKTFDKAFECYSMDKELAINLQEEVMNKISIIESKKHKYDTIPKN